jgi:hypothetical protein
MSYPGNKLTGKTKNSPGTSEIGCLAHAIYGV